jgi:hypothetical protein
MQPLTAAPRDGFTAAQVTALLVAPDITVDLGVDLLDASLNYVGDLSPDVVAAGSVVHRNNYAPVHGTVDLTISRQLAWGYDRVRPYVLLSSLTAGVTGCRFNQGAYLLTTPDTLLEESPQSWKVTGYDQIHILGDFVGDSYSVAAGANVLAAVRTVLTTAGISGPVLLDTAASAKVLATVMTWPLTSSNSPTWLKVINDLLAAISYRGIWCDWDGAFRSGPYVDPSARPSEWLFGVGDLVTGIVAPQRTVTNDLWGVPNWMRFIANGLTVPPVELVPGTSTHNGQYTVQNPSTGLSSQASVGRVVHAAPVFLDAVDDTSLKSQGDALFATATRVSEVISAKLSPFPLAWHFDVGVWSDSALGADRKVQCRSWDLPLDGPDGTYVMETV